MAEDIKEQNKHQDLISVIIPVYNGEKFLRDCLDSVTGQTYKDLQIILIDDGSKDQSGAICDEYASKDPRIEVLHCENGGQAEARNRGLKLAKGEWIGFVDDDDVIEPDMFEVLIRNAKANDVLISGCSTLTVYEDGRQYNAFEDMTSGIRSGKDLILDIFYYNKNRYGALWNKIYHNSLKDLLIFPAGCQLEDYLVAVRVYIKAGKIFFEQKPMYHWIQWSSSQSHRGFHEGLLTAFTVCDEMIKWMNDNTEDKDLIGGAYHYKFVTMTGVLRMMWNSDARSRIKDYLSDALRSYKTAVKYNAVSGKLYKARLRCFKWQLLKTGK